MKKIHKKHSKTSTYRLPSKKPQNILSSHMEKADSFYEHKDYYKAFLSYEDALNLYNTHNGRIFQLTFHNQKYINKIYAHQGDCLFQLGEYADAITIYDKVSLSQWSYKDFAASLKNKAVSLEKCNKFSKAISVYMYLSFFDDYAQDADYGINRCSTEFERRKALGLREDEQNPKLCLDYKAHTRDISHYQKYRILKKYEETIEQNKHIISVSSTVGIVDEDFNVIQRYYIEVEGRYDVVFADLFYDKANLHMQLQENINACDAFMIAGIQYYQSYNYIMANTCFDMVLHFQAERCDALRGKAICFKHLGNVPEFMTCIDACILLNKEFATQNPNLMLVYERFARYLDTIEICMDKIIKYGLNVDVLYQKAFCHNELGQHYLAIETMKYILDLSIPDSGAVCLVDSFNDDQRLDICHISAKVAGLLTRNFSAYNNITDLTTQKCVIELIKKIPAGTIGLLKLGSIKYLSSDDKVYVVDKISLSNEWDKDSDMKTYVQKGVQNYIDSKREQSKDGENFLTKEDLLEFKIMLVDMMGNLNQWFDESSFMN